MMATSLKERVVQARNSGWWWLVGVAAVLVAIGSTQFGAWTQSFLGTGVRWQEAYAALEPPRTICLATAANTNDCYSLPRKPTASRRWVWL